MGIIKKRGKKSNRALEIGSKASTNAALLCRGVDANENKVCLLDGEVYVRGEKEIATTGFLDDVDEPGFIYG
jgi:hypothetical protein